MPGGNYSGLPSSYITPSSPRRRNENLSAQINSAITQLAVGISPRRAVLVALARLRLDLRQQIIGHRLLTVAQIIKVRMNVAGVRIAFLARFGLWLVSVRWWLSEILTF